MVIDIKGYEILCDKGSVKYNEDIAGICDNGAWVLDGATGLNKKNLISKESDAMWYVSWWNNYLHQNMQRKDSLKNIVLEGIQKIKHEFLSGVENVKIEKLDIPSASAVILKFHNDKIEYLILGDCTLFLEAKDEKKIIKDKSVSKLDDEVFKAMSKINNKNKISIEDKKNELLPLIINNRMKKNSEDGYWILEFCDRAVHYALHGFISLDEEVKIMICSDGFSSSCDRYNILNKEEMIEIAQKEGLEYINKRIREVESKDKEGNIFQRFKESDDSSCVYLHVSKKQ